MIEMLLYAVIFALALVLAMTWRGLVEFVLRRMRRDRPKVPVRVSLPQGEFEIGIDPALPGADYTMRRAGPEDPGSRVEKPAAGASGDGRPFEEKLRPGLVRMGDKVYEKRPDGWRRVR